MSLPVPGITGSGRGSMSIDPRDYAEFEEPLMELAQRSRGDLRKLLTAFFGFLHRRTDFYCVNSEDKNDDHDHDHDADPSTNRPSSSMGFKEGDAEKLLLASFRQFPLRRVPSSKQMAEMRAKAAAAEKAGPGKPIAENESQTKISKETSESATTASAKKERTEGDNKNHDDKEEVRLTDEGLQIPVGNGGSTPRYKWTQTLEECTVLIGIPNNLRAKDLDVKLQQTRLVVRSKKKPVDTVAPLAVPHVFVEGDLTERIVPDESTWTLEGGVLQIALYKHQKKFWETVIDGDDKIDTSLVDSQRHIGTYDESTQAQIRKIMFDQSQQVKGLPTSDELSGAKPVIPPLPPGVEYIDQDILDKKTKSKEETEK